MSPAHNLRLLYASVMDWTLRELRHFVTAAETGSFTDAAAELFVSQAAVSRTIASLENAVGDRLLRRVPRGCELTSVGQLVLPHARRVLAEASGFTDFLRTRHGVLRLGYAWAALGKHSTRLQRDWNRRHDDTELALVRHNSPTAGLAEGLCDAAIIRRPVDDKRFESVIVGLERRIVAFASDDPQWAHRRRLRMAEIRERTVIIDPRAGTTNTHHWDGTDHSPQFIESKDVDNWLDAIAAGHGVGTTSEATAHHHARAGITFRPITDGPRIPVRLAWWSDHRPPLIDDLVSAVTELYASG